ncbi:MAG TPA: hypothetical protein VHW69_09700 [Rhizomicrobium sp.]|jgi:hypothetical protein|nr:hypothetical protein [Rhizomicrobium sp.]
MNKLTQTLLTGAALCALGAAPAMAQPTHPAMHVTALYAGHAVNKTKFHNPGRQHITYTYGIYSSRQLVLDQKVPIGSFYKWNSSGTLCSNPKQKLKFPKKTLYGKLSVATETYSFGCPSGPTIYYGTDYKLTDPAGFGNTDYFVIKDLGWFKDNGNKYRGTLNMDVSLTITE